MYFSHAEKISFRAIKGFVLWLCLMFSAVVLSACGDSSDSKVGSTEVSVTVFGDVHFTPFYDPALFFDLVDAPVDQWADIFARSTITEPQSWGKETNYPLLVKTLRSLVR
jgi:hypothetical protein